MEHLECFNHILVQDGLLHEISSCCSAGDKAKLNSCILRCMTNTKKRSQRALCTLSTACSEQLSF